MHSLQNFSDKWGTCQSTDYHWSTQALSPRLGFYLLVLKVRSDMVFPPCWVPFVPLVLGASFTLKTFPWFLPNLHCGDTVLGPVSCWSQPGPADLISQLDLRLASLTMDLSGSHWALGWPWLLSLDLLWQWGTAKFVIKDSISASIFLWFSPLLLFLDSRCWRQSVLHNIFNTSLEAGIDSTVYDIE